MIKTDNQNSLHRKKRIIVVLGMHRSGTSTLTRCLKTLGVELGNNLMQASIGNNEKGFWEDNDIYNLNEKIIVKLGTKWHAAKHINTKELMSHNLEPEINIATSLIKDKLNTIEIFGFKDPRTCLLLPFWQEVFKNLSLDDSYLISFRNPLSVANSLYKRDEIKFIKSIQVWEKHVLSSVIYTKEKNKLVVDYDLLIDSPITQINRIANILNLEITDQSLVEEYEQEFLTKSLRHNYCDPSEVISNNDIPRFIKRTYKLMTMLAKDQISFEDKYFSRELENITKVYNQFEPIDRYIDEIDTNLEFCTYKYMKLEQESNLTKNHVSHLEKERDATIAERDARIVERDSAITDRNSAVAERDSAVAERDSAVANRASAVTERDSAVTERDLAVAERDSAVAERDSAVAERDSTIAERDSAIAERDAAIAERDAVIAKRDTILAEKEESQRESKSIFKEKNNLIKEREKIIDDIYKLYNSNSWKYTKPLRYIKNNLFVNTYMNCRRYSSNVARFIWYKLPLKQVNKAKIKNSLFRNFPIIFKHTLAYVSWKDFNINVDHQSKQDITVEAPGYQLKAVTHDKDDIPTIAFDNVKEKFFEYKNNSPIQSVVKVIAFYLPQFHPFPENDEWWGKGFTEWTNVTKARPNFIGHYQPHFPIHFGYYDLRVQQIMEEQAQLAKQYGIYGFSYYFYWFDGKILMREPLENMLANKNIDIPFCLTWANENWTRRWDGQENDILIAQNHCDEDSLAFIRHIVKYFRDPRYIKINGRPLLIVYRANIIPKIKRIANLWREEVKNFGFEDIYLVSAQSFGITSPFDYGFDASVEFPPHTVQSETVNSNVGIINTKYHGMIFDYNKVVFNAVRKEEPKYKLFRALMLSWDNTARKQDASHIFKDFSLLKYKQWLSFIVNNVFNDEKYNSDEKMVFINAWNEWAEGTHLEPDRKYGYGYLQTTYDVLKEYDYPNLKSILKKKIVKRNNYAVILHLHYDELWDDISEYLKNINTYGVDLYVSITRTHTDIIEKILKKYPDAYILLVDNRGRDILPFIKFMKIINEFKYNAVCKIHSKKSIYRNDGDSIRAEIYDGLLGDEASVKNTINYFENNPKIGMLVPSKYLINHTNHNMTYDHEIVDELSRNLGVKFKYSHFPAGSMFWFKTDALQQLTKMSEKYFELEEGKADGTIAHGIERLFCLLVENNNYSVDVI